MRGEPGPLQGVLRRALSALVEEGLWGVSMADETRRLAWIVLQTANRTQAKGSSVRLVVPRAPEVADELEPPLSEVELLAVEEYLLERGYVAPDDIGLRWGTYTITPAGFYFLEAGLPEPKDSLRALAEEPGKEAALESAIQTELAEEHRRMEEVERELEEVRQNLPGGALEEPESPGPSDAPTDAVLEDQETPSERPWWRRFFGFDQ
jgi:hypothetical protein